jgi:hypothetical protein
MFPPPGGKLWRLAYRFNGKTKPLSFGAYPAVTPKMARERRDEAKSLLARGIDPGERKKDLKKQSVDLVEQTRLEPGRHRTATRPRRPGRLQLHRVPAGAREDDAGVGGLFE